MSMRPSQFARILLVSLAAIALHITLLGAADCGFQVLDSFQSAEEANVSGSNPSAGLLLGMDGALYGVAELGGSAGLGTVFKVTLQSSESSTHPFETIHDFAADESGNPDTALIQGPDGTLYGTTPERSGTNGSIFKLQADGSGFTTLHTFADEDGAHPSRLLLGADGSLYGSTGTHGVGGLGTVFRMKTDGSDFTVMRYFSGDDGANPPAIHSLVQAEDGTLFGTTFHGGAAGGGTVFRIDTDGSDFHVVTDLGSGAGDASHPYGLALAADGTLYGVASQGGTSDAGTVFRLRADGSGGYTREELHSFDGAHGENPLSIAIGPDGALYGATERGGSQGGGTVFRLDADGGGFTVLKDLGTEAGEGRRPSFIPVFGADGALYGTTYEGGSAGAGTLFRLGLNSSTSTWFSPASTQTMSGFTAKDGDVFRLQHGCADDGASPTLDLFARLQLGVDAVDVQSNGDVLFSVRSSGLIQHSGGYLNAKADNLYVLDRASGEIHTAVDWKAHGIDMTNANVDAVDLQQDGSIAFSVGVLRGVTHAGGYTVLRPQSVYRFDPATNQIGLMFDGVAAGVPDIDGIDVGADGRIAFSTKANVFVNGVQLKQQNAYSFGGNGKAMLAFDGASLGLNTLDDFTLDLPVD